MNFRELVDQAALYKDSTRKPRNMTVMAKKCGISRTHLYYLFRGTKTAGPWTIAKIAKSFGITEAVVRRALEASRAAAGK